MSNDHGYKQWMEYWHSYKGTEYENDEAFRSELMSAWTHSWQAASKEVEKLKAAFELSRTVLGELESDLAKLPRNFQNKTYDLYEKTHQANNKLQELQNDLYEREHGGHNGTAKVEK